MVRNSAQQATTRHSIFDQCYEILSTIGRGQNSIVYKALSLKNADSLASEQQLVALKVLIGSAKHPEHNLSRMKREALALVSSRHANVIKLNDFVSTGELCYLSIEYAAKGDLAALLEKQNSPLELEFALGLTIQALAGLQAVHRAGIIHGDIKPENLLLTSSGLLKLADFSIALLPSLGVGGVEYNVRSLVGTLEYLAPETLAHSKYSVESDIYSVATTCYQLLTKELPFAGESFSEQIENKMEGKRLPLAAYINKPPALLSRLDKIFHRALAMDPRMRFQSATEFREELESYLVSIKLPAAAKTFDLTSEGRRKTLAGIPFHRPVPPAPEYFQPQGEAEIVSGLEGALHPHHSGQRKQIFYLKENRGFFGGFLKTRNQLSHEYFGAQATTLREENRLPVEKKLLSSLPRFYVKRGKKTKNKSAMMLLMIVPFLAAAISLALLAGNSSEVRGSSIAAPQVRATEKMPVAPASSQTTLIDNDKIRFSLPPLKSEDPVHHSGQIQAFLENKKSKVSQRFSANPQCAKVDMEKIIQRATSFPQQASLIEHSYQLERDSQMTTFLLNEIPLLTAARFLNNASLSTPGTTVECLGQENLTLYTKLLDYGQEDLQTLIDVRTTKQEELQKQLRELLTPETIEKLNSLEQKLGLSYPTPIRVTTAPDELTKRVGTLRALMGGS